MSMLDLFLLPWLGLMLMSGRDVMAGMDASQMDESLYAAQWAGEEDYHPFAGVRL